jgi:SAM-dependent methyltransferase
VNSLEILACPKCRNELSFDGGSDKHSLVCESCQLKFGRSSVGCWDFRNGKSYEDWFSRDSDALEQYVEVDTHGEEVGSRRQIVEYVVPLLRRLNLNPESTRVLSDGCGIGADVEQLRALGYQAWGVDPGARCNVWATRECKQFLVHSDGTELPFADDQFDFAISEGVIEHVGQSGDFLDADTDFDSDHLEEERRQYCQELYRVLRPGGYALIAAHNRLFPVDFFHGGSWYAGVQMRFHSPRERFLASASDFHRWFRPNRVEIRAVSLEHFFNLPAAERGSRAGGVLTKLWSASLTVLPAGVVSTIGPYFAVLVRKVAD